MLRLAPLALLWVACDPATEEPLRWMEGDIELNGADAGQDAQAFCERSNAVEGDVHVRFTDFTGMGDLACLRAIGGDLTFYMNYSLESLEGLEALQSVGGNLAIVDNPVLISVEALDRAVLSRSIGISYQRELASLTGIRPSEEVVGDVVLSLEFSKVAVDTENFRGLRVVSGNVTLDSATTLAGFEGLESVSDGIIIQRGRIASLRGLRNLRYVHNGLTITGVRGLGGLSGLASLEQVDFLALAGLGSFADLHGMPRLDPLPALYIDDMALASLDGLPRGIADTGRVSLDGVIGLRDLGGVVPAGGRLGSLVLRDLPDLEDLGGLAALHSVSGDLRVAGCDGVADFSGLDTLATVDGDLDLESNVGVTSLRGLEALRDVGGTLTLRDMPLLDDLTPLYGLQAVFQSVKLECLDSIDRDEYEAFKAAMPEDLRERVEYDPFACDPLW